MREEDWGFQDGPLAKGHGDGVAAQGRNDEVTLEIPIRASGRASRAGRSPFLQKTLALVDLDPAPSPAPPDEASQRHDRRRAGRRLPPELRPRERLLESGVQALSSAELLALLAGSGGSESSALRLAGEVISETGGLVGLRGASMDDLLEVRGVGVAKACTIVAAVEFGKRLAAARHPHRPVVSSPADVDSLLRGRLADLDRECFVCVLLNAKNEVLGCPTISVGTLTSSLVHPREVFKPAIKASAASVILAHNHPTGKVEPSPEDRQVTRRLADAAGILGIAVLDHVIIGDGYHSMKEHGTL